MKDTETVRAAIQSLSEFLDDHESGPHEEVERADAALARIVRALNHLTSEHGTQCQCPGCEVLREGA